MRLHPGQNRPVAPAARESGFTLVEIILVLAIIGILTAVAAPQLVRSMRGNRLSAGARTLVRAGRYARSMAVITQRPASLALDIARGTVTVTLGPPPEPEEIPLMEPDWPDAGAAGDWPEEPPPEAAPPDEHPDRRPADPRSPQNIHRELEGVHVEYVEIGDDPQHFEGAPAVVYQRNGKCTPYRVRIADNHGGSLLVSVDALGGTEVVHEP